MESLTELVNFLADLPALIGLVVAALIIFLTADWRWSLSALLVQYVLIGVTLYRFVRPEIALVKILVGGFAVPILYLTARKIHEAQGLRILTLPPTYLPAPTPAPVLSEGEPEPASRNARPAPGMAGRVVRVGGRLFFGLQPVWGAGPLGLPLRFLAVILVVLAIVRLFGNFRPGLVPMDIAFIGCWLGGMGIMGLVLSGDPLRVAPAALSILAAFDLVYTSLEQELAIIGMLGAFTLLAALAFSYLAAVQTLQPPTAAPQEEAEL